MTRVDLARLSDVSSGVPSGTAFPGTPSNGDLFYRTDLDLLFRYRSTGTRWVSTTLFTAALANQVIVDPLSANNSKYGLLGGRTLYLEEVGIATQTAATNDGSNYWTITANVFPSGAAVGSTVNTSADTAGGEYSHTITIGAAVAATEMMIGISMAKTLTPGAIYVWAELRYRIIAT